MKSLLMTALLVAGVAHVEPLDFKGFKLGATGDELRQRFASLNCARVPAQFMRLGDERCTERGCQGAACQASTAALDTYLGMPAVNVGFSLIAGHVEAVDFEISANTYEAIRDALRAIHGAGVERTRDLQTSGGARVTSRTWEASVDGGTVTVAERATRTDTGGVRLQTATMVAWMAAAGGTRVNLGDR